MKLRIFLCLFTLITCSHADCLGRVLPKSESRILFSDLDHSLFLSLQGSRITVSYLVGKTVLRTSFSESNVATALLGGYYDGPEEKQFNADTKWEARIVVLCTDGRQDVRGLWFRRGKLLVNNGLRSPLRDFKPGQNSEAYAAVGGSYLIRSGDIGYPVSVNMIPTASLLGKPIKLDHPKDAVLQVTYADNCYRIVTASGTGVEMQVAPVDLSGDRTPPFRLRRAIVRPPRLKISDR